MGFRLAPLSASGVTSVRGPEYLQASMFSFTVSEHNSKDGEKITTEYAIESQINPIQPIFKG